MLLESSIFDLYIQPANYTPNLKEKIHFPITFYDKLITEVLLFGSNNSLSE